MSRECCRNIDEQRLSKFSLIFICIGACLTLPSLLWPVDMYYQINPHLSAKENEERQEAHSRMLYTLSTIAFVGMGFIGVGAIITSVLVMKIIVLYDYTQTEVTQRQGDNKGDLQPQPKNNQVISAQDKGTHQQKTSPSVDAPSAASSTQPGTLTPAQAQGKLYDDKDVLVDHDHLQMNRDISNMKQYGSMAK